MASAGSPTTILTREEIQKRIERLTQPGDTVFFYLAASPSSGGPLGKGAAVVELNPSYPGKHQKKYIVYTTDVSGTEPVGKGRKWYDADKAKDIAGWVKERHYVSTKSQYGY